MLRLHLARIDVDQVRLVCNQCGLTVGTVQLAILSGLLGLDAVRSRCPWCGAANVVPAFDQLDAYVCQRCGASVELARQRTQ